MGNQKQVQAVRHFRESFKQEKVREIERNLTTVMEVSKVYGVTRAAGSLKFQSTESKSQLDASNLDIKHR